MRIPWDKSFRLRRNRPSRLIEPLTDLVAADMAAVNQTILSRTGSEVTTIPEVANHLISSGGKRLRPILTLATAGAQRLCRRGPHQARRRRGVHAHRDAAARRRRRRQRHAARQGGGARRLRQSGERAGRRFPARPGVQDDGRGRLAAVPGRALHRRRRHRRGRGDAAHRRQEHRDHRGRLSRGDPRQDGGFVRGGLRGRADPRQAAEGGDRGLPRLWRQSRRRLPTHRRRARLRRLGGQARQERRRRFPRGQDHAARGAVVPPRRRRPSASSGSARWRAARCATAISNSRWRR